MKFWLRFSFVLLGLVCGCSEDTEIRSYTVAKKPAPAIQAAEPQPARTLGVIVPNNDTAWFLKMMDDPAKVDSLAADFRQMASSLEFDPQGKPRWTLAPGWSEQVLDQITYAKFSHEGGATATLTKLSANTAEGSEWQKYLIDNINRWRDQLGLMKQDWPSMQPELEEVPELSTETAKAYYVSLNGMRKTGGMGMGSGAPFLDRMRAQQAQSQSQSTPPSQTASDEPAPQESSGKTQLKYELPAGWKELSTGSGIRLATFEVKEESQVATVAVSTASGELESTIQMWYQQVGVEPDDARIKQVIEAASSGTTANNFSYQCYQLKGEGESAETIRVAVIAIAENQKMFVKMKGPSALVDTQAAAMDQLVGSLQW